MVIELVLSFFFFFAMLLIFPKRFSCHFSNWRDTNILQSCRTFILCTIFVRKWEPNEWKSNDKMRLTIGSHFWHHHTFFSFSFCWGRIHECFRLCWFVGRKKKQNFFLLSSEKKNTENVKYFYERKILASSCAIGLIGIKLKIKNHSIFFFCSRTESIKTIWKMKSLLSIEVKFIRVFFYHLRNTVSVGFN